MHERRFDALTRHAAHAVSRRHSLLTLGGAAVASAVTVPSVIQAGQTAKRAKKRKRQKCRRQIDQCLDALTEVCEGEESCINNFDHCCPLLADCKAGAALDCLFTHVN